MSDIDSLISEYENEGCDFSNIEWVVSCAKRMSMYMPKGQSDCFLYTMANEIEALQARVARLENMKSCPNCDDVGWYVVADNFTGEPLQEQCQWCYETTDSKFNVLNESPQQSMNHIIADGIEKMLRALKPNKGSQSISKIKMQVYAEQLRNKDKQNE